MKKNDTWFREVGAYGKKKTGRFDALIEAADALEGDKYLVKGEDGYMHYTDAVKRFFYEAEQFFVNNPDFDPRESMDILHHNGFDGISTFDLSDKDEHCVMALLLSIMGAEKFNDHLLSAVCEMGIPQKAAARLKELEGEKQRMPRKKKSDARSREATDGEKTGKGTRRSKRSGSGGKFDELFGAADALKGDRLLEKSDDGETYYTDAVKYYIEAVYRFSQKNPEYDMGNYDDILMYNGFDNYETFDVSDKDAECCMAMLIFLNRGEHFGSDTVYRGIKCGLVERCIARLRELDEKGETKPAGHGEHRKHGPEA